MSGRPVRLASVIIAGGFCLAAAIRLSGAGLAFVPGGVAVIVIALGGLELLSVGWNVVRGEPWNDRTFFDYISDALVWLPWP